jgi:hypothetical protein
MNARGTLRASLHRAAARKRMRLGQLQTRFRFKHRHVFDDFWGEQLLDLDIADAALVAHAADFAGAAALEVGRA